MNVWDVVALALVGGALVLAIRRVKKAKGGCSCGSGGCTGDCASCRGKCSEKPRK